MLLDSYCILRLSSLLLCLLIFAIVLALAMLCNSTSIATSAFSHLSYYMQKSLIFFTLLPLLAFLDLFLP